MDIKMPPGIDMTGKLHPCPDVIYLISYPRCGSTWLRYCFEFITKRASNPELTPIWNTGASLPQFLYSSHEFEKNPYALSDAPQFERHWDHPVQHIWIRRDPYEAISSQTFNQLKHMVPEQYEKNVKPYLKNFIPPNDDPWDISMGQRFGMLDELVENSPGFQDALKFEISRYLNLLVGHNYLGNGLALRYEDLITDPEKALTLLIDYVTRVPSNGFIRETLENNLQDLLDNFDYHQNSSLNEYRGKDHLAATVKGKTIDLHYYSKNLSPKTLEFFDHAIEKVLGVGLAAQPNREKRQNLIRLKNKYLNCYDRRWWQ